MVHFRGLVSSYAKTSHGWGYSVRNWDSGSKPPDRIGITSVWHTCRESEANEEVRQNAIHKNKVNSKINRGHNIVLRTASTWMLGDDTASSSLSSKSLDTSP
jgi:hypothetical protein